MPKRLPPNNRPWPENLAFDFALPALSPADAEAFISTLPTSDRNKRFLLLRYKNGRTYNEIADEYGLTPAGVRLAIKSMWEKFGDSQTSLPAAPPNAEPTAPLSTTLTDAAPPVPASTDAPPVENKAAAAPAVDAAARPLSINLSSIRRTLGLTAEEFARPIIEDGEALITRLETGFSKPSPQIVDLICDAWGVPPRYLLTGNGLMFEQDPDYCSALVKLLKKYLSVATFDRQGQQYWKGSLVDVLSGLIDVGRLDGREMARIVRVLYDYLDVESFEELLERMGRNASLTLML